VSGNPDFEKPPAYSTLYRVGVGVLDQLRRDMKRDWPNAGKNGLHLWCQALNSGYAIEAAIKIIKE